MRICSRIHSLRYIKHDPRVRKEKKKKEEISKMGYNEAKKRKRRKKERRSVVTDIGRGRGECGGGVREKGERKEEWRERKGRMPKVRGNKNGSVNVRAHVRQPLKSYDTHSMLSLEEKTMEQVKRQATDIAK